ncbi:MAG: YchF-related putative GTPase [Candidatus Bathyarchaeota archaeon]|nr:YchF-related putative GTPase [Candidatus Bathyarchaeota archaeon]
MLTFAIVGKTNVGKTTLFNAATLLNAEISNYPFTTKEPNFGTAYVCDICVCQELGVEDNPQNSACIEGWRYIPVRIIDVPGLLKDAWTGRGLGNRFLSAIGQADALIHVVDASGSIDEEGNISRPGSGNPVQDVMDIEMEMELWICHIIERNKQQITRDSDKKNIEEALTKTLTGIKTRTPQVIQALKLSDLEEKPISRWRPEETLDFSHNLLPIIKPTLLMANKMDLPIADDNLEKLIDYYSHALVAASSAEAELALRLADKSGLIEYSPGQEKFRVIDEAKLTIEQKKAIDYIEQRVLYKFMRTGIQQALNTLAFKLLKMNMVYPVSDEAKYSDNHGNILPDVHLMHDDATPIDLARTVHSRLAENYILAVDARTGLRLPKDYALRHRDIVKIMTQKRAKSR